MYLIRFRHIERERVRLPNHRMDVLPLNFFCPRKKNNHDAIDDCRSVQGYCPSPRRDTVGHSLCSMNAPFPTDTTTFLSSVGVWQANPLSTSSGSPVAVWQSNKRTKIKYNHFDWKTVFGNETSVHHALPLRLGGLLTCHNNSTVAGRAGTWPCESC